MKHTLRITLILLAIFLGSQIIGLGIINAYVDHKATGETGNVTWTALPYDMERPVVQESTSFIYIVLAIIIGTIIILFLIKWKQHRVWKFWFFLSILIALTVAFKPIIQIFISQYAYVYGFRVVDWIAIFAAAVFGFLKISKPNVYLHNFTELFIYGGIAAIFVPILNIFSAVMLLIIISGYDIYAVWHSKHMVKMANFQTESKLFAGLMIGYKTKPEKITATHHVQKSAKAEAKTAVLGGGDIAFPLLFSGVILKKLMLSYPIWQGFLLTLITTACAGIALFGLLYYSKKDKFYPAMPYISAGCFAGLVITLLIAF